jgi:hypothetical protein
MEHPFFYIVVAMGILTALGIIAIAINPLLKDKQEPQA